MNRELSNGGRALGRLSSFGYDEVRLSGGRLEAAYEQAYRYYMAISVDDMLYGMRKKAGLDTRGGKSLDNEEGSWYGLGGNVLGQWLQAYARFYAATGRIEALAKAEEFVAGLDEIAAFSPVFFDGTGMYFFEKYLRGLTDNYVFCGSETALRLAVNMLESVMASPVYVNARRMLGDNGPSPEIEWYTISESVYFLADVLEERGEAEAKTAAYRAFAARFEYTAFWDIFYRGDDLFHYSPLRGQNTAYFHAYSHLNSFNSAAYCYCVTGNPYYLESAKRFYRFMRETQELATGGYGTHLEWLMPKTGIINALQTHHDSFETQCDCYAVYRLSDFFINQTGEASYADWMERLLFNGTLASIDMDEMGHIMYYSDYCTHSACKYLHPNTWTCCTGTRPLLLNELRRSIFFHSNSGLYAALFVNADVTWNGVEVSQRTAFPYEDTTEFTLRMPERRRFSLHVRRPEWLAGKAEVTLNGRKQRVREWGGWLELEREFSDGDVVRVKLPMKPVVHAITSMGDGIAAVNYGPVTLAAEKRNGVLPAGYLDFSREISTQLARGEGLTFTLKANPDILFRPYLEYGKGEEYYLYFGLTEK